MKKIAFLIVALVMFTLSINAQGNAPYKIVNMEDVEKYSPNCDFDDETVTATFKGQNNRWLDVPGIKGDLTGHTKLSVEILKSNIMLTFSLRYKDADGKTQQVKVATCYSSMGKEITAKKVIKIDLTNKGKVSEDILKNVSAIRISMAKQVSGAEEPYSVQFGKVTLE